MRNLFRMCRLTFNRGRFFFRELEPALIKWDSGSILVAASSAISGERKKVAVLFEKKLNEQVERVQAAALWMNLKCSPWAI